jgi:predicted aconitase
LCDDAYLTTVVTAATAITATAGEDGLVEELEAVGVKCVREETGASPSMTEAQFMNFNIDPEVSQQPFVTHAYFLSFCEYDGVCHSVAALIAGSCEVHKLLQLSSAHDVLITCACSSSTALVFH